MTLYNIKIHATQNSFPSKKQYEPTMENDLFSSAEMDPQTPEIRNKYKTNPPHHAML